MKYEKKYKSIKELVIANGQLSGWVWLESIVACIVLLAITVVAPVQLLKKPDSKYLLPQEQLDKYHRIKNSTNQEANFR